jgi:UrcA family protein
MNTSIVSTRFNVLRSGCALALALGALTVLNAKARADELDPITVSAPISKKIMQETATEPATVDVTVNARIDVDMETLKNESGVVLLKDRVEEAAYKACYAADPMTTDDGTCVANAMKSAKPQVAALIARARSMG